MPLPYPSIDWNQYYSRKGSPHGQYYFKLLIGLEVLSGAGELLSSRSWCRSCNQNDHYCFDSMSSLNLDWKGFRKSTSSKALFDWTTTLFSTTLSKLACWRQDNSVQIRLDWDMASLREGTQLLRVKAVSTTLESFHSSPPSHHLLKKPESKLRVMKLILQRTYILLTLNYL